MKTFLVALISGIGWWPPSDTSALQATPSSTEPIIAQSTTAMELLWNPQQPTYLSSETERETWKLISVRYVATDTDFYFFGEIQNASSLPLQPPILSVELLTEGQSFGVEEIDSANEWVTSGGSAYYQSLSFFGNSLRIGDWDDQRFSGIPNVYRQVDVESYESIEIDAEMITNVGPSTIGKIYFAEITRDSAGVFSGSCLGPSTGALIPIGKSIRAAGLDSGNQPGGCGFSNAGIESSQSLGYEGDSVNEFVIASIEAV